jgi:hypothetical protein
MLNQTRADLGIVKESRFQGLGISSRQLAARLGYLNLSKGARRIDELCRGDFAGKERLLAKLPGALTE